MFFFVFLSFLPPPPMAPGYRVGVEVRVRVRFRVWVWVRVRVRIRVRVRVRVSTSWSGRRTSAPWASSAATCSEQRIKKVISRSSEQAAKRSPPGRVGLRAESAQAVGRTL